MTPQETIGETIHVVTADHPPRTDSPKYGKSRKWLMGIVAGGCYICGGPADLTHPEAPANAKGLEDHHGGGIYHGAVLVGFGLFPLEWSMGWGADPMRVDAFARQLFDAHLTASYTPIKTVDDVMAWVDSTANANVKLCNPHHVGHQTQHTPDQNGHEAVGIHNAPWPVLSAQATWDWTKGDMFGGTTGTIAVSPRQDGTSMVTYVHPEHPGALVVGQVLPATHPTSRAAHTPVPAAA
jgi:hypothetical protein